MTVHLYGRKIGRLLVTSPTSKRQGKSIIWKCICDCGAVDVEIPARDLLHGNRRGCGRCADTSHPLYSTWRGIISRCTDENSESYANYGGRGITICDRWKESFLAFVADMGPKPREGLSIDRKDVNGNYEPGNCRWASNFVQANNKQPISYGLTDQQLIDIYWSKEPTEKISEKFGCSEKTVRNIKARSYSAKATDVIVKEMLRRASSV